MNHDTSTAIAWLFAIALVLVVALHDGGFIS